MSKLSIVRKTLESNPAILIVNVTGENYFPERKGFFSQTVDFIVAPKKGIYSAPELQLFMMGLVPGLEPTCTDDFRQYGKTRDLSVGKLYFDEKIAEEKKITRRIITSTDDELTNMLEMVDDKPINFYGFEDGKRTIDTEVIEDHLRRTWVRPYPDVNIAKAVLEGKIFSPYNITAEEFEKYRSNFLQRMINK